jgi:hypothetical protein
MKLFKLRTPIGAIALSILAADIQQGSAKEDESVYRRRELDGAASIPLDIFMSVSDLSLGSLSFISGPSKAQKSISASTKASKAVSASMSMSKAAKAASKATSIFVSKGEFASPYYDFKLQEGGKRHGRPRACNPALTVYVTGGRSSSSSSATTVCW